MAMLFPDTGAGASDKKASKGAKKLSQFATAAQGKGREGSIAGLAAAGANVARPLTVLGSHQWVATKSGVKRVKRR